MEFLNWFAEHWILGWLLILIVTGAVVNLMRVSLAGIALIIKAARWGRT